MVVLRRNATLPADVIQASVLAPFNADAQASFFSAVDLYLVLAGPVLARHIQLKVSSGIRPAIFKSKTKPPGAQWLLLYKLL